MLMWDSIPRGSRAVYRWQFGVRVNNAPQVEGWESKRHSYWMAWVLICELVLQGLPALFANCQLPGYQRPPAVSHIILKMIMILLVM